MTRLRSGEAVFRPRARLLKLIGAELISDDVVAVTELVKNAHDADASCVTIQFRGVAAPGGEIVIRDDGCGMDLATVLGVWMEPGGTSKVTTNGHNLTPRGRRLLGEKGVGRFAVDKLGRYLELVSRRAGSNQEVRTVFDWDEFAGHSSLLSDIRSRWETRQPTTFLDQGTILRISGLRSVWNERMFRRLSTRLSRLRSPFRGRDDLTIELESNEFPEYSGELRSDFLNRAPYRIEAKFDGEHTIDLKLGTGSRSSQRWTGSPLACGPVRVQLFAFDLETEAIAGIGPRMEVRAWLKEWSGVSVYRDGFRVWPYGEPHDDWLRLDQRRVNNPVVRLSNNQVVGFVEISRDGNPDLRDQTNREGLLHNDALRDLRRIVYYVLEILEDSRQAKRHPTRGTANGTRPSHMSRSPLATALDKLIRRATPELATDLKRFETTLRESAARDEAERQRSEQTYAELAAAGQAAALLSLSLKPLIHDLQQGCSELGSLLNGTRTAKVDALLKGLECSAAGVATRISGFLTAADGNVSRRTIDIGAELRRCRKELDPLLAAAGVEMQVSGARGLIRTEMRPDTFRHLVYLLVRNSIDWTAGMKRPSMRVSIRPRGDRCDVLFTDNGPGIDPGIADRVCEPFFSRREGGMGMGLAIARSIVASQRGELRVLVDGRRRGAAILISLPRKRSRATSRHT